LISLLFAQKLADMINESDSEDNFLHSSPKVHVLDII